MAARNPEARGAGRRAGRDLRVRPGGGLAAVGRAGGHRGSARIARLAHLATPRSLALPRRGSGGPARLEPATLLEPGFQLSFAAVGAIFVVVPRIQRFLDGYPVQAGIRDVIAISLACGAATAPILWLQFGSVPVYSLLANALVTFAIGPLLGIALAGALLEPLLPSATLALAWLNGWLAAYVATCARLVARLPFAQVGIADGGLPAPRNAARDPAAEPAAALAAATGARVRRRSPAGTARVAALACGPAAAAERSSDHGARRRPGRLDPRPGAGGCRARRPGAARGARRPTTPQPRCAPACGARPHAPAAGPHRWRGGGARAARRRTGARSQAALPKPVRGRSAPDGGPPLGSGRRGQSGRCVAARPSPRPRALAGPAGCARSGSEQSRRRAPRELRRGGRAPHGRRGDRRHGTSLRPADRDPQGRAPRVGRCGPRDRVTRAAARRGRHLLRAEQRLRPSDGVDTGRSAFLPGPPPLQDR